MNKHYSNLQEVMAAFFAHKPREIKGHEIDGWCGLEGTGYIADVPAEKMCGDRYNEHQIVMDVTPDGMTVGVYHEDGNFDLYGG